MSEISQVRSKGAFLDVDVVSDLKQSNLKSDLFLSMKTVILRRAPGY